VVRKKFSRKQLLHFTANNLQVKLIVIEACGGSHFLGRALPSARSASSSGPKYRTKRAPSSLFCSVSLLFRSSFHGLAIVPVSIGLEAANRETSLAKLRKPTLNLSAERPFLLWRTVTLSFVTGWD